MTIATPREEWRFESRLIGGRVLVYDELPSTNDAAMMLASDITHEGCMIVAEHQTAGRGQYGRTWQSRRGASLLMSVLVFPPPELRRPVLLTAWAAVSVAAAIQTLTGVECRVKWPNDLLVDGKKICGILIEQSAQAGQVAAVVGIGLNLNQTYAELASAGLPTATSLHELGTPEVTFRASLEAVLRELDARYAVMRTGNLAPLRAAWSRHLGLIGARVRATLADGNVVEGTLVGLDFDGIEVLLDDGRIECWKPERLRQLHELCE